jgi:hypothetical protein
MRVTFRIPLGWALLSGFLFACAMFGLVASVAAWFYLMTVICSNPRAPVPLTQHVIPHSCHGMKVFIPPWQDAMLHWLGPVGLLFMALGLVAGAALAHGIAKAARAGRVRIVAVPPGEAPEWVRAKWVGLELPLAQPSAVAGSWRGAGVLSGPRGFLARASAQAGSGFEPRRGFVVNARDAVAILERESPEAAQWWRTNAAHLMKPSRCLLFPEEVCSVVQ